jgi:hypothetical protein
MVRLWVSWCVGSHAEYFSVLIRKRFRPAEFIANNVNSFAGGEKFAGRIVHNFVLESDFAAAGFGDARAHSEQVIITGRALEAALAFADYNKAIVLFFHVFVNDAEFAEKFYASDFKPDEKVGMVDDAHLIGFGVTHADSCLVKVSHESDRNASGEV